MDDDWVASFSDLADAENKMTSFSDFVFAVLGRKRWNDIDVLWYKLLKKNIKSVDNL